MNDILWTPIKYSVFMTDYIDLTPKTLSQAYSTFAYYDTINYQLQSKCTYFNESLFKMSFKSSILYWQLHIMCFTITDTTTPTTSHTQFYELIQWVSDMFLSSTKTPRLCGCGQAFQTSQGKVTRSCLQKYLPGGYPVLCVLCHPWDLRVAEHKAWTWVQLIYTETLKSLWYG